MPLARIFTCYPQQTSALSEQLQQQGYEVEVLSPDQAPDTLADLEIQLEVCDPADVLRRATDLAARLHADIAIAPGALQAAPAISAPTFLEEEQIPATAIPVMPAALAEPPASLTVPATEVHSYAQAQEEQSQTQAPPVFPSEPPQAARTLGAALAACTSAAERFLVSARDQFQESRGLARVRLAEAQVVREQRLLDLARRRADVREQLLELRAGRHVLDAYLIHLKQQGPAYSRQPQEQAPPTPEPAAVSESLVTRWKTTFQRIHLPLGRREAWIAGLVSVAALLAIGLTVGAFNTRPTPTKRDGAVSTPGGVTLQASQPANPASARPSPAIRQAVPNPPAQATKVTKPSPARRAQAGTVRQNKAPRENQQSVGNDVVVRHFPAPKPTPQTQANGWKHFSDISN
jgi:hypothetical protein